MLVVTALDGAFFAVAFFAGAFFAGAVFTGAFFAVAFLAAAVVTAVDSFAPVLVAFLAVGEALPVRLPFGAFLTAVLPPRGSFFEPLTRSLKLWPGRNFGTEVSLTKTGSPVWGLRAYRAALSARSKEPKPVTMTRSPSATARAMASNTA
ncbi:hypothetical protein AR457_41165 [Streptomyces agglomeratus]|nr:hypothetical protein AR457_41165 [Streptomyces agglomeratus]